MLNGGWTPFLLAAAILMLATGINVLAAGRNPNPGVLPVGSTAFGKTLG